MPLNPFRSEAEAYRFVWLTIGYFGLIVAGAVINKWLGLAVFIGLSAVVLFFYFRRGERRTRVLAPTRARTAEDERRILVIANETVGGETLRETIRQRSEGWRAQVLVVTPALNTPLKHWVSDDDQAFGTIFFSLTGLHGAHVLVGLTILAAMTTRAYRGHFSPEAHNGVEIGGIYWHFVDVMWIIVFTTVYVL